MDFIEQTTEDYFFKFWKNLLDFGIIAEEIVEIIPKET